MLHIQRIDPFGFFSDAHYITFIGAGGKSSLIEYIADMAVKRGKTAAITTTTKIYAKEPYTLFNGGCPHVEKQGRAGPVRIGKALEGPKLTALSMEEVECLGGFFDVVLIEADGAKGMPLKYPARHEPVVPPFSDRIVAVAGLDALGGAVGERVFRWTLLRDAEGVSRDAVIDADLFLRFFTDSILLKGAPKERRIVFLNKWDALRERGEAMRIARSIAAATGCPGVIISSVFHRLFYRLAICDNIESA